jgi:hypothetical protein
MTVIKITAAALYKAGYAGKRGGNPRGAYYAIQDAEGICSIDGKAPYILQGPRGKAALESIIEAGGFLPGTIAHVASI